MVRSGKIRIIDVRYQNLFNSMKKDLFLSLSIIVLLSMNLYGQLNDQSENPYESGINFKIQAFYLFPFSKEVGVVTYENDYELTEDSNQYGFDTEINYMISPYFGVGLGTGIETLQQPKCSYFPLYLNLFCPLSKTENSLTTNVNFGIHLGNVDKLGFILRSGIGYRTGVGKKLLANFEITYSFQNLYKSFENSGRISNYYNLESLGFKVGIEVH